MPTSERRKRRWGARVHLGGLAGLLVLGWAALACGQGVTTALIEKTLDAPAQVNFRNITLEEALEQLSQTMGVPLALNEQAAGQLPYGRLTQLSAVQLQGMAWRDALRELLAPLLLTYQVGADRIYVTGTPELLRQPRPLNVVELSALAALRTARLDDREGRLLRQIRSVTRMNFALLEQGRRRDEADKDATEGILAKTAQPATAVLDQYSQRVVGRDKQGAWYVQAELEYGKAEVIEVRVVAVEELTRLKLQRRVDVEFKNARAPQALEDLAGRAGLGLVFEPGCLALLEETGRGSCRLAVRGGTVQSALEELVGLTGLTYRLGADRIEVAASEALKQAARAEAPVNPNPTVCVITTKMPGAGLDAMIVIHERDLKEAGLLQEYRQFYGESLAWFYNFLRGYQAPQGGD